MKMHTILLGVILLLIVGAAVVFTQKPAQAEPTTFEECAALYPVMESYPRQCSTPNGKHFVEEIPEDENPSVDEEGSTVAGIPDLITVNEPNIGDRISSPLTLTGSARGTWYFEASFPIEIRNSAGAVIGTGHAEAQDEWMTEDFVPFKGVVTFTPQPAGSTGTVVLMKDNPSGLPEHDRSIEIPVVF